MKQTCTQLITLQSAMWRLKAEMLIDQNSLQDMRDLAWEELHLRHQLRSLQIQLEVNEEVDKINSYNNLHEFVTMIQSI